MSLKPTKPMRPLATLGLRWGLVLTMTLTMILGLFETAAAKWSHSIKTDAPPFNVAAKDMKSLLGGNVQVGAMYWGGFVTRVFGRNGQITYCYTPKKGKPFWRKPRWWPGKVTREGRTGHGYFVGRKHKSKSYFFRLLQYFPKTGKLDIYSPDPKTQRVYRMFRGHIQKGLPAAVYKACPDFPSARSLGVQINKRQTSTSYRRLVFQNRGQRIKRPDLVTPGLRQLALPKNRRKK